MAEKTARVESPAAEDWVVVAIEMVMAEESSAVEGMVVAGMAVARVAASLAV